MPGGVLLLIVGPSGVGKDTLIGAARTALEPGGQFGFPRRSITDPADRGENHVALSVEAFAAAAAQGAFALHWRAHGLRYGIPREIDAMLAQGNHVLVNVSRTVLDAARATYARRAVVSITAPPEQVAERLRARGREDDAGVRARLTRAVPGLTGGGDEFEYCNDRPLAETAAGFVDLLRQITRDPA